MSEQLKLFGNIIEFPKNRQIKNQKLKNKLDVAYEFMSYIVERGYDFSIVISRDAALELFDEKEAQIKDYLVLRSDREITKKLNINNASY